jgi:hypothetical protein
MRLENKPDFDACAARIDAWWQRQLADRPPVSIWTIESDFLSETFPYIELKIDPEVTATVFGADLEEFSGNVRALPLAATLRDIALLQPNFQAPLWQTMLRGIDQSLAIGRRAGRLICMPNLYTGPDLLATLRGPENLCIDLTDDPDGVLAAAHRCQDAFETMFDDAWRRISVAGFPCCTAWTPLLHTGPAYPIGCDFAGLISPAMYQRSLLPVIERAIGHLDRSLYHFDGERSLVHLDAVLALPRLDAVHYWPGPGEGPAARWTDVYRRIQAAGKALQLIAADPADARTAAEGLRPEGVWFCIGGTHSLSEAEDFIAWTARWAAGNT